MSEQMNEEREWHVPVLNSLETHRTLGPLTPVQAPTTALPPPAVMTARTPR